MTDSSQQSKTNNVVSSAEKNKIIEYIESLRDEDKWRLSSGKYVEDEMLSLIQKSYYEHPAHSLIMDSNDNIWSLFFTRDELKEIRSYGVKHLSSLSEEVNNTLQQFEFRDKTALHIYQAADEMHFHPIQEYDQTWIKESVKLASALFFDHEELTFHDYSEADLMHKVWDFVYKLYSRKNIRACLGERVSRATSCGKNSGRSFEAIETRPRKSTGAKVDILFKGGSDELGCCEMGKHDVEEVDDKYINDGLMKLPKTLKDMLAVQVQENPSKINELVTVGYLMMGTKMELILLDVPKGKNVTRITRTKKFAFPSASVRNCSSDSFLYLKITWR